MPSGRLIDLIPTVRALALAAGEVVMRIYAGHEAEGIAAETKADGSPVTRADQAAETLILAGLRDLTPDLPIVAEEATARGEGPERAEGVFWLVDPLDGTKEFINRNGEFTVNIALIAARRPVLGVVLAPALGDLYIGAEGIGASHVNAHGTERPISARTLPENGAIAVGSRSHGDQEAENRCLAAFRVVERRARGSSLKFCLVAEGEADLYPRLGRTCEWDTAAGHAVLAAAGGRVDTLEGTPLLYGKPSFFNPGFLARGR